MLGVLAIGQRHQARKRDVMLSQYPPRFQVASQEALKGTPTGSLISAYLVYLACSSALITNAGITLFQLTKNTPVLGSFVRLCARKTFYAQFCGGETESEAASKVDQLRKEGIRIILAYECEDKADVNVSEDQRDEQCQQIIEKTYRGFQSSVIVASSQSENMVAIKLSSLIDVRALRSLNIAVERAEKGSWWTICYFNSGR